MSKSKKQAKAKGEGKGGTGAAESGDLIEGGAGAGAGTGADASTDSAALATAPESGQSEEGAWVEIGGGARAEVELADPRGDTAAVAPPREPSAPQASSTTARRRGRGAKGARGETTLAELARQYLAHLEEAGKSSGTIASYGLELQVALAELGAETKLAELTSERVMLFFGSERVTTTRGGRAKSPLSIAKTQRVVRQALVFAQAQGLIEQAPLPEGAATH